MDNHTQSMMPSTVPANRRDGRRMMQMQIPQIPSLWDQRNNSALGDMPFGFKEIDFIGAGGQGGNKHAKGKGATEDRITDLGPQDDFGNFYVPGPQDEYEAMMARMAKAAQQDIEQLGIGIDDDDDDGTEEFPGLPKDAKDSYELINDFLVNLESCDEPLTDIINTCFAMMTSDGQRKIQTDGLQS